MKKPHSCSRERVHKRKVPIGQTTTGLYRGTVCLCTFSYNGRTIPNIRQNDRKNAEKYHIIRNIMIDL